VSVFTEDWLKEMEEKKFDGKAFIKLYKSTREKYLNIVKTKGYPWKK